MKPHRQRTRPVMVGNRPLGSGAEVAIQSMTNTDTRDVAATVAQIHALEAAGCEIVRVAILDMQAASAIAKIKAQIAIPLVADIHFDGRLAVEALRCGVDKLRINPGNLPKDHIALLLDALRERPVPVRIGVNAGSLPRDLQAQYGVTGRAMMESALRHVRILEENGYEEIVISLKAPDVPTTVEAYRLMAEEREYPLHLGVTHPALATGLGLVKSAMGIGALLIDGIGDTLRVSLTGDPEPEVAAARSILMASGVRREGVEIIACPTCGRCRVETGVLEAMVREVEDRLKGIKQPLTVAIMGCEVNGPGEAKEADVGIAAAAGGASGGVLFCKGKLIKRLPQAELVDRCVELALELSKKSKNSLGYGN